MKVNVRNPVSHYNQCEPEPGRQNFNLKKVILMRNPVAPLNHCKQAGHILYLKKIVLVENPVAPLNQCESSGQNFNLKKRILIRKPVAPLNQCKPADYIKQLVMYGREAEKGNNLSIRRVLM